MPFVTGTVYEPPEPGFPYILVFFDAEGDVRVIRIVESAEAGRAILDKMAENIAHFGLAELKPREYSDLQENELETVPWAAGDQPTTRSES